MKAKIIKVLKVAPGKAPTVVTLNNDLDSLQKAVSEGSEHQGLIEIIPIAEDGTDIICNDGGKLIGLEPNRRIGNDILVGTFYVVGGDEEGNLCSLTDKQLAFYNTVFAVPDVFEEGEVEASIFFEVTDFPEV